VNISFTRQGSLKSHIQWIPSHISGAHFVFRLLVLLPSIANILDFLPSFAGLVQSGKTNSFCTLSEH
jgi:hypothetical protein